MRTPLPIALGLLLCAPAFAGPAPRRAPPAQRARTRAPTKTVRTASLLVTGKGPVSRRRGRHRDHRAPSGEVVFDVPVKVDRLHRDITRLRVHCAVSYNHIWVVDPNKIVATGASAEVAVQDGWFQGNIKVAPRREPGKSGRMGSYSCVIQLQAGGRWFGPIPRHPQYPPDPDEPLRINATGRIR